MSHYLITPVWVDRAWKVNEGPVCESLQFTLNRELEAMAVLSYLQVVRGGRQSKWSMVTLNRTEEAAPSTAPRDLTVKGIRAGGQQQAEGAAVRLEWRQPKVANGKING